jgi:hypothetical protein
LWAEQMRAYAEPEERTTFPSYIPWVHEGGREELHKYGLSYLAQLEDGDTMAGGLAMTMEEYQSIAEECLDAMGVTPTQVLEERKGSLVSLIREVAAMASEEDMDQVEALKHLEDALAQDAPGRTRQIGIIAEEAPTIHYLYYTLTMMKSFRYVRDRCLQQAQLVDMVLGTIWQKGLPSQVIQQLKDQESPVVRRSKEAIRFKTKTIIRATTLHRGGSAEDGRRRGLIVSIRARSIQ